MKMLILLEFFKTRFTGKLCIAKVDFAWNIGIGYHRRVEDACEVEFYLIPFMIVSITSFPNGGVSHSHGGLRSDLEQPV